MPNGTPVPTHLFKVVAGVKNGKFQIESFVMENTEIPLNKILRDFVIDLKTLESKSGLTFFPEIQSNLDNDSLCDENGCNV